MVSGLGDPGPSEDVSGMLLPKVGGVGGRGKVNKGDNAEQEIWENIDTADPRCLTD